MNTNASAPSQLELGLENRPRRLTRGSAGRRRFPAARWWFDRMRDAVHSAQNWPPTPETSR